MVNRMVTIVPVSQLRGIRSKQWVPALIVAQAASGMEKLTGSIVIVPLPRCRFLVARYLQQNVHKNKNMATLHSFSPQ